MLNWKQLVAQTIPADELDESEITFGEPCAEVDLANAERELGITLPSQLRAVLASFNGAQSPLGEWVIFDLATLLQMNTETRTDYASWDLPHPIESAVAFSDIYGTGDLCALAVVAFGGFQPGEVLLFDHETGEYTSDFKEHAADLESYLRLCQKAD